jgi:hypothetical protein
MQPIATRPEPPKDIKQRLKVEAENAALNAVGALSDAAQAFNRSSKYFKYRVFIVGALAFLAASTFWAACPTNPLAPKNDLGAVLVVAGDASRPVYMVKNESTDAWENVVLIANKEYRAMSPRIDAGGNFTITPKQLIGGNGKLAPPDLKIVDLEIRTDDGSNVLLENGEQP